MSLIKKYKQHSILSLIILPLIMQVYDDFCRRVVNSVNSLFSFVKQVVWPSSVPSGLLCFIEYTGLYACLIREPRFMLFIIFFRLKKKPGWLETLIIVSIRSLIIYIQIKARKECRFTQ